MNNKSMQTVMALLLALSVLIAGCSGSNNPTPQPGSGTADNSPEAPGQPAGEDGNPWFKKYEEPITVSTHMAFATNYRFHGNDSAESNGLTRWMEDKMGIKWKMEWTAPDGAADSQKLELAFASNKLPDVIQANPAQVAKYAAAGKLVPMDELIEKYASPLVKWAIQDAEERTKGTFFAPFTINGTPYALPIMSDTLYYWKIGFIRDDIVKELGLEVPQTLDELEKLFAAYHAQYPDGYAFGLDNTLDGMKVAMSPVEAYPGSWIEKEGEIVYGSIQPEVREGLQTLAEWYQKGWVDKEFVVKDFSKVATDITQGKVLSYYSHWSSVGYPLPDMWRNIPDSSTTVLPFLTGPAGKTGFTTQAWFPISRAVTTSAKHPEAFIYILNDMFDSMNRNNVELRALMQSEYGYAFKYPVTEVREAINKAEIEQDPNVPEAFDYPEDITGFGFLNDYTRHYSFTYGLTGTLVGQANGMFGDVAKAGKSGQTDHLQGDALQTYNGWSGVSPKMVSTFADVFEYWDAFQYSDSFHVDAFSGAPTPTMTEKQAYLDKIEVETFTKIIMGTAPITAFDDFVNNWNKNGGTEITKEINEWKANIQQGQ